MPTYPFYPPRNVALAGGPGLIDALKTRRSRVELLLDGLLPPRATIAPAHAEDYGSSDEFFSSGVGEIDSFT